MSLATIRRHLSRYGICFIAPESLDLASVRAPGEEIERFPDACFEQVAAYNRLATSSALYERFAQHRYILICQLDCLILHGELEAWLNRGFDYLAAPWFMHFGTDTARGLWRVGNGGLSLRNVGSHLRVLRKAVSRRSIYPRFGARPGASTRMTRERGLYRKLSLLYKLNPFAAWTTVEEEAKRFGFNEDIFWSIEAPKFDPMFRVPSAEEALPFAFEAAPRWCFERNGERQPFGCHAWARYDRAFWLEQLG